MKQRRALAPFVFVLMFSLSFPFTGYSAETTEGGRSARDERIRETRDLRAIDLHESEEHPEVERDGPIEWGGSTPVGDGGTAASLEALSLPASGPTLGANLVPNPNLESGTGGSPASWKKGGYGSNERILTYPVSGVGGSKAMQVTVSNYASGDAKWYSDEINVTPGSAYQFSDYVKSTAPSIVTMRFKKSDGSFIYTDVLSVGAHTDFTKVETTFTVPSGVESLSIFHLLKQNGTLITDDYSLREFTDGGGDNLLPNPEFEIHGGSGLPASWFKGGYGSNSRTLTYPVTGVGGSQAVRVSVSNYASGDAKWYHEAVPVESGIYTFKDQYQSDAPSIVTAQFHLNGGGFSYLDIATLPPSSGFREITVDFSIPSGVSAVTIFHLLKQNGTLTMDSAGLFKGGSSGSVFENGAVSFAFDDGWDAHHNVVLPKLNGAGMKGTFYLVSERFDEDGFPAYMSKAQAATIHGDGHEIGAHTRTHRDLTTLSSTEQHAEIEGSKQDLEGLGLGPITTFAYPFGSYTTNVLSIVKNTPYDAARSTIDGNVIPSSDRYQLPRFSVESHTTLANVQSAVENALLNNEWIILTFHRVDQSGLRYSTTPSTFNAIVDHVEGTGAQVVTVAEGIESL